MQFCPDAVFRKCVIELEIAKGKFIAKARFLAEAGWRTLLGNKERDEENDGTPLPVVAKDDELLCEKGEVHFPFLTQQLVVFSHHRQRSAVVLFVTLFVAKQRTPARFRQKTRFGNKFAFGDLQLNDALAEHRVRAELHQILTRDQVIDLRFVLRQVDVAGPRRRDDRMVGIDVQTAATCLKNTLPDATR